MCWFSPVCLKVLIFNFLFILPFFWSNSSAFLFFKSHFFSQVAVFDHSYLDNHFIFFNGPQEFCEAFCQMRNASRIRSLFFFLLNVQLFVRNRFGNGHRHLFVSKPIGNVPNLFQLNEFWKVDKKNLRYIIKRIIIYVFLFCFARSSSGINWNCVPCW